MTIDTVYDVTKYIEDHPGGIDALVEVAGKDATNAYEDVGHSEDSREILEHFVVGISAEAPAPIAGPALQVQPNSSNQLNHVQHPPRSSPTPPQQWEQYRSIAIYLASLGSVAFVGYEAYARNPKVGWLHFEHGGFWRGLLVSSAIGVSVATALTVYLGKAFSMSKDFTSYPAHMKPINEVVQPVTDKYGVLNPREYKKFPLIQKDKLSSDAYRFVFALPQKGSVLGLPIGQHVAIRADIDGKTVSRSYTPISNNRDRGRLELCIKVYPDGALTGHYLVNLNIGDTVEFRGPKGQMRYRKGMAKSIGMVAGGSGITPMYQVLRAICEDRTDSTTVSLLYANNTENDILLRRELDNFAMKCPDKFKIWYILSKPPKEWKHGTGFVTKDLVESKLPSASPDSKIFLCGPPGMLNAMKKSLVELGFETPNSISKMNDQVFLF